MSYVLLLVIMSATTVLPGCMQAGMSLLISGIETGIGSLESSFASKPKKIDGDQVARLRSGMTKNEVNALLQKSPITTTTMSDGGSVAVYAYNDGSQHRSEHIVGWFGLMDAFTQQEKVSQTLMVQFDSRGRYVTHTLEETRVCGSQATGFNADNCGQQKTAGVN